MLQALWHWYISAAPCGPACDRSVALTALAGVAAVVWTGGLIAYQFKQYAYLRMTGLDMASIAFMFSIIALFMQPLALRITLTVAFFYYLLPALHAVFYKYVNTNWVTPQMRAKWPAITPEGWVQVTVANRAYSATLLGGLLLFLWAIYYPYQDGIAWVAAIALFLSYQLLIYHFNTALDNDGWLKNLVEFNKAHTIQLTGIAAGVAGILQHLQVMLQIQQQQATTKTENVSPKKFFLFNFFNRD